MVKNREITAISSMLKVLSPLFYVKQNYVITTN